MENEKYGVELEAKTNLFKKSLLELSTLIRKFSDKIKEEVNIVPKIDTGGYTKQIDYIKRQMKDLAQKIKTINLSSGTKGVYDALNNQLDIVNKKIKEAKKEQDAFFKINPVVKLMNPDYQTKEMRQLLEERKRIESNINNLLQSTNEEKKSTKQMELEAKYERLQNLLDDLTIKQKTYNGELEQMNKQANTNMLGTLFDKSIGKIKRFSYYLLGARSAFSMFMKYQSIYYQYNEKMQYQSELSQNAIALSLAPAFEFLGNMIAYASIGFAKFIELLTGVNVLSKVSTKGIRDYNKSLKETQSLLSGVDEIANLNMPTGTGLAEQYKALNDFQKKVEEVEEFFKKNKWISDLANGLKTFWEWVTKIYDYIKLRWDFFKYIFGGIALAGISLKLSTTLSGLAGVLGTSATGAVFGTGLLGLASLFKYLATLGIITITVVGVVEGIKKVQEFKDTLWETAKKNTEAHETYKKLLESYPDIIQQYIDSLDKTKKGTEGWEKKTKDVRGVLKDALQNIVDGKLTYDEYKPAIDKIKKSLEDIDKEEFKAEIDFLAKLDTKDAEKSYSLLVAYMKTNAPNVKLTTSGGGNGGFGGGTSGSRGSTNTTTTKTETKTGTSILSSIINAAKKGLSIIGLKTGLDYVPYDDFPALLHKGETVVPAKYNPTVHSVGNEYTNRLLETLVMKIDDLSRRPNEFIVDGQKFASATYPLYEEQRNRQNYVEGVVVR